MRGVIYRLLLIWLQNGTEGVSHIARHPPILFLL